MAQNIVFAYVKDTVSRCFDKSAVLRLFITYRLEETLCEVQTSSTSLTDSASRKQDEQPLSGIVILSYMYLKQSDSSAALLNVWSCCT